jgi:hypothetical protein
MKLTESEIELLRLIAEAQYLNRPVIFYEDHAVIDAFKEKYGAAFRLLIDKLYIDGGIGEHSFIILTGDGEKVLKKLQLEEESRRLSNVENKKVSINMIAAIISAIIGTIVGALVTWFLNG